VNRDKPAVIRGAEKLKGKVYIVGAGSGALDLLTVRALRLLEECDVVFYDALVNPEILECAKKAKLVSVGKRCGYASTAQRFINRTLVAAVARYQKVVRLKGGDPMMFGRAQEEIDALKAADISFEIVPGISAAFAASADLGVSLTKRGVSRSVVFVTPRVGDGEPVNEWIPPASAGGTIAVYMASKQAGSIQDALLRSGYKGSTPAVFIESASFADRRIVPTTLAGIKAAAKQLGGGPSILLIGDVYEDVIGESSASLVAQSELILARQ